MHAVFARLLQGLSAAAFLTACIGESTDSASTDIIDQEQVQVSGAGIKGPLAFADAKLFAFDPSFSEFYDKNSPISSTITSQYAEMSGLSSPKKLKPPFILTIGGAHAIDLNTGTAPVISTLVTVVTEDMLQKVRSDFTITQPVYASPLTSLAFNMARNNSTSTTDATAFLEKLGQASALIARTFNVDLRTDFDVLRSPLVINEFTDQMAEQETAVHHRAAAEAFAAKVHMSVQSLQSVSAEMFIEMLARDLNDGVIDNASHGTPIGGIDAAFINQNGMKLLIPNTGYLVEDTMALMQDERVLIGTDGSPEFLVESIDFGTASDTSDPVLDPAPVLEPDPIVDPDPVVTDPVVTDPVVEPDPIVEPVPTSDPVPSTTAFPVDLRGTAPEEAWVMVNVNKPADALTATISMTVLDADRPDEGDLTINGNT
ncbi:MAG: hypothetical protein RQ736_15250, partial [Thiogranum sp.]|nr:hypothetical protein [Thiogranum sp.]